MKNTPYNAVKSTRGSGKKKKKKKNRFVQRRKPGTLKPFVMYNVAIFIPHRYCILSHHYLVCRLLKESKVKKRSANLPSLGTRTRLAGLGKSSTITGSVRTLILGRRMSPRPHTSRKSGPDRSTRGLTRRPSVRSTRNRA